MDFKRNLLSGGVIAIVLTLFNSICLSAKEYSISDYGAVGNGIKVNTANIQAAINACHNNGGGSVVVPAGRYLTGSIQLKSNVNLQLAAGAYLVGSENMSDYPCIGYKHNELGEVKSLVWAMEAENVSITGYGEIDCRGEAFMDFDTYNVNSVMEKTVEYTDIQKTESVVKFLDRPNQPIFFHNCKDVCLEGVKIKNAPCWTVTMSCCSRVRISSVIVDNNPQISNSDAIHLSATKDVIISDCALYAGDDCVAITCITDWDGCSEDIVISNSILSSRSACIRVGHLASKVRNVIVSGVVMKDSNRGVAVFSGDGGVVENISFDNIIMQTGKYAGGWWGKGEPLVVVAYDGGTIEDVTLRNIKADVENSIVVSGSGVKDLVLDNWDLVIRQGHNVGHFNHLYELSPAPYINSPDPHEHIPFIYAEDAENLILKNIDAVPVIENGNDFSISPVYTNLKDALIDDDIVKVIRKSTDWAQFGRYANLNAAVKDRPYAVLMGDSITDGWDDADPSFFSDNDFIGRGISGQTTCEMLVRFRQDVVELSPKYVVILAGINDIALNNGTIAVENVVSNIISMCEIARSNKISPVICSITPASEIKWCKEIDDVAEKVMKANEMLKSYAKKNKFIYVDYHSVLKDSINGLPEHLSKDGVHPNKDCYSIMGNVLKEAIL